MIQIPPKSWFVMIGEKPKGPYTTAEMQSLAEKKAITFVTLVRQDDGEPFPAGRNKELFEVPLNENVGLSVSDLKGPLILASGFLVFAVAIPTAYFVWNKLRDYRAASREADLITEKQRTAIQQERLAMETEERKQKEDNAATEKEELATAIAAEEANEKARIERAAQLVRDKQLLDEAATQHQIDMQKMAEEKKIRDIYSLYKRPLWGDLFFQTPAPKGPKKLEFDENVAELTAEWTAKIFETKGESIVSTCAKTIRGLLNRAKPIVSRRPFDFEGFSVSIKVKIQGRDRLGNSGIVTILAANFPASMIAKMNPDGLPFDELLELGNAKMSDAIKEEIFELKLRQKAALRE